MKERTEETVEQAAPQIKMDVHFDSKRIVHWSKPVWWDRVRDENGIWIATPHYGRALTANEIGKKK